MVKLDNNWHEIDHDYDLNDNDEIGLVLVRKRAIKLFIKSS